MTHNNNLATNRGLSEQFCKEILDPSLDLGIDYSELFIDDLIENEALSEIPIVKSIVGLIKTGISINQFWFAKKLLTFIKEFNSGDIDQEKKIAFQEKISKDDRFRKKVTEQLMVFLDRHIEINKSKILSNILKAYIEDKITYNNFISIGIYLENLHPDSYWYLKDLEDNNFEINEEFEGKRNFDKESLLLISGIATETSSWSSGLVLKNEGRLLYLYGIKPIIK